MCVVDSNHHKNNSKNNNKRQQQRQQQSQNNINLQLESVLLIAIITATTTAARTTTSIHNSKNNNRKPISTVSRSLCRSCPNTYKKLHVPANNTHYSNKNNNKIRLTKTRVLLLELLLQLISWSASKHHIHQPYIIDHFRKPFEPSRVHTLLPAQQS